MTDSASNSNESRKGPLRFLSALFVISLALNCFLFFRYARSGMQLEKDNNALVGLLEQSNVHADSLQLELEAAVAELESRLSEAYAQADLKDNYKEELDAKAQELESAKQRIAALIAEGRGSGNAGASYGDLAAAKQQIEELQSSNESYIEDLDEMRLLLAAASSAADQFSSQAEDYNQENDSLMAENDLLNQGLAEAKTLRLNELHVTGLRERRDQIQESYDASKLLKLKITFKVLPSLLVEHGSKEIVFRITGSNGVVLSDHVTELTPSEELYSFKQDLDYLGEELIVTTFYQQKAKFKEGPHRLEVFHDGKLLDVQDFNLD